MLHTDIKWRLLLLIRIIVKSVFLHIARECKTNVLNTTIYLITGNENRWEEYMYSSTLSFTSDPGARGWSIPRPSRFAAEKENRYPLYRKLGGPRDRYWWMRKSSPPPGFDPRTVHPVASPYTDWAIPYVLNSTRYSNKFNLLLIYLKNF